MKNLWILIFTFTFISCKNHNVKAEYIEIKDNAAWFNIVNKSKKDIEKIGEAVYLINGDSRNIKVTTLEDFKLVKAILGLKGKTERPAHKRF